MFMQHVGSIESSIRMVRMHESELLAKIKFAIAAIPVHAILQLQLTVFGPFAFWKEMPLVYDHKRATRRLRSTYSS
jgi:hypothetical protein